MAILFCGVGFWFTKHVRSGPLADLGGGDSSDAPPIQILSFSCSFWEFIDQVIGWRPHLSEILDPPLWPVFHQLALKIKDRTPSLKLFELNYEFYVLKLLENRDVYPGKNTRDIYFHGRGQGIYDYPVTMGTLPYQEYPIGVFQGTPASYRQGNPTTTDMTGVPSSIKERTWDQRPGGTIPRKYMGPETIDHRLGTEEKFTEFRESDKSLKDELA